MIGLLNKIHSTPAHSSEFPVSLITRISLIVSVLVPTLLDSVRPTLLTCQETCAALAALVPPNEFWRWKDMWCNSLRAAVFSAALVEYLTSGTLITLSHVRETLGSKNIQLSSLAC